MRKIEMVEHHAHRHLIWFATNIRIAGSMWNVQSATSQSAPSCDSFHVIYRGLQWQ